MWNLKKIKGEYIETESRVEHWLSEAGRKTKWGQTG